MTINFARRIADYRFQYPGQLHPQPAYIRLDCREGDEPTLSIYVNGEINGTPYDLYTGLAQVWRINSDMKMREVNALMRRVAPLAKIVAEGFYEDFDRNGNRRGYLNDDAQKASEAISQLCEEASDEIYFQRRGW